MRKKPKQEYPNAGLDLASATPNSWQRHQKEFELTVYHPPCSGPSSAAQPGMAGSRTNVIRLDPSQNVSRPDTGILRAGVCGHRLVWGSGCNRISFGRTAPHPEVRLPRASAASTLLRVAGSIWHRTERSPCRRPRFIREIVKFQ